ncbi:MAG TPA: undecaprenyldiphospho-muramoylpentapeptide beta-N-acetylglucosaminyltransferase [Vicinamibacterales bacterium]|nr:undecaprenyldiphospho-muramoylpentapeptide beta-N-acetylglucosaminyltransferase [Vicinamibacterales bacterium]
MTAAAGALTVVIAGGGTGGHLYPGIAVARELQRVAQAVVTFAGTAAGIEARVVPHEGFELDVIRSAGLKGKSIAARLRGAVLVPAGLVDAWRLLSRRAPDVVIGVGGYSSGPVVMAAALRGIPTMVMEQNAIPGFTNRSLARFVRAAAVTWPETAKHFGSKAFVSGNPVRAEFLQHVEGTNAATERDARGTRPARVLIFGGSQGAHALNLAMVEAAPELVRRHPGLEIVHQTGAADLDMVRAGYQRAGLEARVEPFLYAMDREMNAADLVICRAGATTLAELAAAGKPAVLVPLPTAADDHQRKNAEATARAGAASVLEQPTLTGASLAVEVSRLVADPGLRARMSAAAHALATPDAARVIAERVRALAGKAKGD